MDVLRASRSAAEPLPRPRARRRRRWDRVALLFLLPWAVHMALFTAYPLILAFAGSVSDWNILTGEMKFVGLRYYAEALRDPIFYQTLWNTAVYLLCQLPPSIALGVVAALLLNQRVPGWQLFRAIYFLPVIVPVVVLAIVWQWMLGTNTGVVNYLLGSLGIAPIPWLTSERLAMPSIALMKVWADAGFYAVLFLAGLQSIPRELLDAARVDGASSWQVFWRITLPLLNPVMVFAVVMGTLWAMQVFSEPLLMTEGGPQGASTSTLLYLYRQGFDFSRLGYASASGVLLGLLIMVLTVGLRRLVTRDI